MKYGILGDIHANLSALDTVLQALQRDGADVIVSVGDVVGYGAAPKECIARLREIGAHVVLGNHDAASIGRLDMIYFNQYAKEAVLWTQREGLLRLVLGTRAVPEVFGERAQHVGAPFIDEGVVYWTRRDPGQSCVVLSRPIDAPPLASWEPS